MTATLLGPLAAMAALLVGMSIGWRRFMPPPPVRVPVPVPARRPGR